MVDALAEELEVIEVGELLLGFGSVFGLPLGLGLLGLRFLEARLEGLSGSLEVKCAGPRFGVGEDRLRGAEGDGEL